MGLVAVVGTGAMGSRVAMRLQDAGHELVVYDVAPKRTDPLAERGIRVARSAADAGTGADIAFTSVPDASALMEACLGPAGLLTAEPPPRIVADVSTVAPAQSAVVAEAAERLGVGFLRCPVSGTTVHVESGTLTVIASGPREVFEAAAPYLAVLGQASFYLGPGEAARYVKLAVNLMVASEAQALAEAYCLIEKSGIDPAKAAEVFVGCVATSPIIKLKTAAMLARDFSPAATTRTLLKDLDLALATAGEVGVELPASKVVRDFIRSVAQDGMGDLDFSSILLRLENLAGLQKAEDN